jgi:hypothetical protein
MVEREPAKETIGRGDLFFLWHPGTEQIFSGYGLAMRPGSNELLAGLLMVDRPRPADPEWLAEVEATFGECRLVAMTPAGERGIACQMQIEPDSLPHLRRFPGEKTAAMQTALKPLLHPRRRPRRAAMAVPGRTGRRGHRVLGPDPAGTAGLRPGLRDSYNPSNLLWLFDLSWWRDVLEVLVGKDGKMSPRNAKRFLQMLADREPVFEANLKKVKPAKGETRAEVEEYFRDKYERLKAFLRQAIDRKESVQCSL